MKGSSEWHGVLRRWRRRPFVAVVVVATMAASIAGAAATFSVTDALLLRPLPFADPATLVRMLGEASPPDHPPAVPIAYDRASFSIETWRALQASSPFSDVGAWSVPGQPMILQPSKELVTVMHASANLLDVLGLRPVVGRGFRPEEDTATSDAALIGHRLWRGRFGADPDIAGARVVLGRLPAFGSTEYRVVGVLPPGFALDGRSADVVLPFGVPPQPALDSSAANVVVSSSPVRFGQLIGRLRPDASLDEATAAVQSLMNVSDRGRPLESARAVSMADDERRAQRRPALLQFGGALIILLIACSSVGVLFHQELQRRAHEVTIRTSLGAGAFAAIRPLVFDFAGLGLLAVVVAVPLSWWATGVLLAIAPPLLIAPADLGGAPQIAVAFALVAGLVAAAIPVLAASVSALRHWKLPTDTAAGGRGQVTSRIVGQRTAVALQLALALVLVTAASLFAETLLRLTSQPLGFAPDRLLVVSTVSPVRLSEMRPGNPSQSPTLPVLAAIPGVTSVAATSGAPFQGAVTSTSIDIPGIGPTRPVDERVVSSSFFETAGVRPLQGETFSTTPGSVGTAVVSDALAREFFGGQAVGRSFRVRDGYDLQIVGVVPDVKVNDLRDRDFPTFYTLTGPMAGRIDYLIRFSLEPGPLIENVRSTLAQAEPTATIREIVLAEDLLEDLVVDERFRASLASWFAAAAVFLAGVALYGVARARADSRAREFGLRMALGATGWTVQGLVLMDVAKLVALGLAVGLPLAFALARSVEALVYGVSVGDWRTFVSGALVLAFAAVCAAVEPASRAARIAPMDLLRE